MARLEHRMDLMLERFAHQDKRLDDLITTVNVRFDDFGKLSTTGLVTSDKLSIPSLTMSTGG
jgi:hypothetical protein